jgi:hypothetical protein
MIIIGGINERGYSVRVADLVHYVAANGLAR